MKVCLLVTLQPAQLRKTGSGEPRGDEALELYKEKTRREVGVARVGSGHAMVVGITRVENEWDSSFR
jgi:hypothetical protein